MMFDSAVCVFRLMPSSLLLFFFLRNVKAELQISLCSYRISFRPGLVLKYQLTTHLCLNEMGRGRSVTSAWRNEIAATLHVGLAVGHGQGWFWGCWEQRKLFHLSSEGDPFSGDLFVGARGASVLFFILGNFSPCAQCSRAAQCQSRPLALRLLSLSKISSV